MATTQLGNSIESSPQQTLGHTSRTQECVLLIEDSEDAMLLVRYALQEQGAGKFRLEWAKGLSEGLDFLSRNRVDIVLLDLGLPDSSGPSSYAWVREIAPEVPVLVLTGDTRAETEFAVTASGVEDYLVKDEVSGALLIQAINAALYANRNQHNIKSTTLEVTQRLHWKAAR